MKKKTMIFVILLLFITGCKINISIETEKDDEENTINIKEQEETYFSNFNVKLNDNLYRNNVRIYDDENNINYTELIPVAPEKYDSVSFRWLPNDLDNLGGGSHNGRNYFSYTFFVKNVGKTKVKYEYSILIGEIENNVDESVRIKVYKNGEAATYAKVSAKGTLDVAADKNFFDENLIIEDWNEDFNPGDIDRYTIVMWIEGNDPECTSLSAGKFNVSMFLNLK